ncbi:MAG: DUF5009 domain-containing protein [Candidatus Eremiobacteraeota bacterium]|nr:DUF5009 domain-containing protein [Candidatus Eremiobacteraeota bacterium]
MEEKKRLISLDLFRGATIAGMLLVNNPGTWSAIYAPLEHAEWNGCTFADLIFPFFLFIMGMAIPLAFRNRRTSADGMKKLHLQILRRALLLFALGLLLNSLNVMLTKMTLSPFAIWPDLRIPGVLQRIAICYLFASLMVLHLKPKAQVLASVLLILGYALTMNFVPVERNGTVIWEAGIPLRDHNLAALVDASLLGNHVWKVSAPWDPEGVLSTLPAIATTLFGAFAGYWILREIPPAVKVRGMAIMGALGALSGYLMNFWVPLNKNIWSSSYTLFTGGLALLSMAFCYWLVDVRGARRGLHFFIVYGSNAITVFVLSGIFARFLDFIKVPLASGLSLKAVIYSGLFASWLPDKAASLGYALAFVMVWYGIMAVFYKKRIFLKI